MSDREQENEVVLFPGEYCFYMDRTTGDVSVVVGPCNQKLSQTDKLVQWDMGDKRFIPVQFSHAKQKFITIPEGWYAPLKNPAVAMEHPTIGASSSQGKAGLTVGKKVNISGPDHFALWPGQMAKVIEGHKLRSNQYLLVRVYDVEAFKRELAKVVKVGESKGDGEGSKEADETNRAREVSVYDGLVEDSLATGQQFIIKGTHVHFYIPPDGIEVVPFADSNGPGGYVHNAVTLEQLQYCILQDEDGKKRYVRGPDVVFPEPTEKFLSAKGGRGMASKKFMAVELNETSGIYVEVIRAYKDEATGRYHEEGDELFITGADQKIYFPREEHAIIKYGDQDRHYAVALPSGEGRYVLDRIKGGVTTEMGPSMFLPDPRSQVIVKRVLSERETNLLFPGNEEVRLHNDLLRSHAEIMKDGGVEYRARSSRDAMLGSVAFASAVTDDGFSKQLFSENVEKGVMGDSIDRQGQYTPPRSITLKNKFDGVVAFDVWNGYAVLISNRNGERRVVEGPDRVYLEYDESPEAVSLSTNTPKNHDRTIETAFLRTRNNVVGEQIVVETNDLCEATVRISMRVDFVGDTDEDRFNWFSVDNYIKLLCERVNSLLKNHVRQTDVMNFYQNSTNIVRDIILGESKDGGRPGLQFADNGMVVSEVEVLSVTLSDHGLSDRLRASASDALSKAIALEGEKRDAEHQKQMQEISTDKLNMRNALSMLGVELDKGLKTAQEEAQKDLADLAKETAEAKVAADTVRREADVADFRRKKDAEKEAAEAMVAVRTLEMNAEAAKVAAIMGSIQPDLTAALASLSENDRIAKLAEAVGPEMMFGEEGVLELMKRKFGALGFENLWQSLGIDVGAAKLPAPKKPSPKKK